MSTNHTANYDLCQWQATDPVIHTDFNEDNAKIDAALAQKADAAGLTSLNQTVAGLSSTVAGHTAALAGKGNCQVFKTSYVGTGTSGSGAPLRMTFPAKPIYVLIVNQNNSSVLRMIQGVTQSRAENASCWCDVGWSGNIVGWYADDAESQMNGYNITYHMVALLECD